MGPALLSMSTTSPGVRVVVFGDEVGLMAARRCASAFRFSQFTTLPIDALGGPVLDYNASLGTNPRAQGRFTCASAKLMVQGSHALRSEDFILVFDVDIAVNEPLNALWRLRSQLRERQALWGLVSETGESVAALHEPAADSGAYYNTGVVLVHAKALRRRNLTHPAQLLEQLSTSARRGKTHYDEFGLGEQNLLNAWLSERPELASALPCRWNRRIDRRCEEEGAGVRHANRLLGKVGDWEMTDQRLRALLSALPTSPTSRREAAWPERACTAERLRAEWRGNESAVLECVHLVAKRWARDDVRPWHQRYLSLPCAGGGERSWRMADVEAR